jgi:alpha-glucosidase (family GH31 glycosyl hydrolase)
MAGAGALVGAALPAEALDRTGALGAAAGPQLSIAAREAELVVTPITEATLRINLLPVIYDVTIPVEDSIVFARHEWPEPAARFRSASAGQEIVCGNRRVRLSSDDAALTVAIGDGKPAQELRIDLASGVVRFTCKGRIFGLGEGGPQLDRSGHIFPMRNGEDALDLAVNGARLPIPWLMSTEGWGLFFHSPIGTFDLSGPEARFAPFASHDALPLDVFVVLAENPVDLMREYALLTGFPHLPPLWTFGYQQSHRTLASRDEILAEARTFREKKLPCDVLIYLGTGFCPSGWNTGHGSFTFNSAVFPDPGTIIEEFHKENFKVALHVVNPPVGLHGHAGDTGTAASDETEAAFYWKKHLDVFRLGIDGWWADEGDALGPVECLVRNRMYSEGPQMERPRVRPYALHRNGYAGLQRYGWLWSGDIDSTWDVLRAQIAVGINTGLSGIPFWGTDTGGFVTTPELTGELYARWFQFSAFCPLFRSHGRTWKLRRPWQWNTGDYGPTEMQGYHGKAGLPDPGELHNPEIEPVCRKYLELRSRLMPYTYSIAREAHDTGLPMMRALWLHYPDDPRAAQCSDQYLWGRDILVAPVTDKAATERQLYLPRGSWRDYWTEEEIEGGRTVTRKVDLSIMPLYVRAGAVIPLGPVRQFTAELRDEPLELTVYPGADGEFALYEDDGATFDYERGQFMRTRARWADTRRTLTLDLAEGSRWQGPRPREVKVRLAGGSEAKRVSFNGRRLAISWMTDGKSTCNS